MSSVRVAAIQHNIAWQDAEGTCRLLEPTVAAAVGAGARLILLAEMFSVGFSMDSSVAERSDGPSTAFLVGQAARHGVWIGGTVPVLDEGDDRPANRFVLAGPDGAVRTYDKIHPFSHAGEHEIYRAGDSFTTVDVDGLRVSLFICYDLRFADEFWAVAPDTDCYLVPANWPESRRSHWQALLRARAIENQAYVVGVNRVGEADGLCYVGDSAVIDPMGEVLASAAGGPALLVVDIDPLAVAATRDRFRFLADRRSSP